MSDYRAAVARRAPAVTRGGGGDIRGAGWVIAYADEPQLLIEYPDGSKEWWLARLTDVMDEPPAQAAQNRPSRDGTPSAGGADGQDAPDAAETHTRAALAAIHDARTTGGQQGTTYALTAIAHAILARTENP